MEVGKSKVGMVTGWLRRCSRGRPHVRRRGLNGARLKCVAQRQKQRTGPAAGKGKPFTDEVMLGLGPEHEDPP